MARGRGEGHQQPENPIKHVMQHGKLLHGTGTYQLSGSALQRAERKRSHPERPEALSQMKCSASRVVVRLTSQRSAVSGQPKIGDLLRIGRTTAVLGSSGHERHATHQARPDRYLLVVLPKILSFRYAERGVSCWACSSSRGLTCLTSPGHPRVSVIMRSAHSSCRYRTF